MRFITVPAPFVVMDPLEDRPAEPREEVAFVKFVRLLCMSAAQKQTADTLQLIDIRASVAKVTAGQTWEVPDEWHTTLAAECKRLGGWAPHAVLSAGEHLRAVVDAPNKAPAGIAASANGAVAAS
jgi:hypothetical protein